MAKTKIAIVGMSFRFPGTSAAKYWPDLLDGRDLVTTVEPSRWSQDAFSHPGKNHAGSSYTFAAGSIGDISTFDAAFFGISPREATQMDPQQRLLLEMSWEALENGGIKASSLKGTSSGVFIGISSADYAYRFADDLGAIESKVATGNTASIAANRISYVYDLRGPSMALDTACSSSLVAFHQACQSIRSGESSLAITGGVSLHLHPYGFIAFSKASMLSRRGRCNVFDAAGDGYVRSEGGGIFILKDYDEAIADGNNIVAVVAGTAVNSDGKKSGLTVPSSQAQADLLTHAYASAEVDVGEIDYIEAHGTGTAVGDPIETRALAKALGKLRPRDRPLLIGSVKSNLGHLEAASGVAGLVKAAHCVQHRTVPATININALNPHIPFDEWNIEVARKTTALKPSGRLIIGVNSFGFGGANAHVILESVPATVTPLRGRRQKSRAETSLPIVVSGKTPAALSAAAADLAVFLREHQDTSLYDIAWNTFFNRDWHEHRVLINASTHRAFAQALEHFAEGTEPELPIEAAVALDAPVNVAFVYSGNGSQWEGMGKRLLEESTVFKTAVREVDALFKKYGDFSLEDELAGKNGTGRYVRTEIAQPALFAYQVGITAMLRAQGMTPTAVTGHSVGEVAAAWACGALSLEQSVQVIFHRSCQQGKTRGLGQMTATGVGEQEMSALLQQLQLENAVAIAGVNSDRGVTLAGKPDELAKVEAEFVSRKIVFKRLDLDYAFHSSAMDTIESGIYRAFSTLVPSAHTLPFVSTVTGDVLQGALLGAYYWWQNIRNPVQFSRAIATLRQLGTRVLVEIGPHPVLRTYLRENSQDANAPGRVLSTGVRDDDTAHRVLKAVSQALLAGVPVDMTHIFPEPASFVPLPNYPWQKERYWQAVTPESANILSREKVHPLLGYRLQQQELAWENPVDLLLNPVLADHRVGEATVLPGTAFAELGLAAARQWQKEKTAQGGSATPDGMVELEELEIRAPLLLDTDHAKLLRVDIDPSDGAFTVQARGHFTEEAWTVHATGRIPREPQTVLFAGEVAEPPSRPYDFDAGLHRHLTLAVGLHYGPAFQAVGGGWIEKDSVWAHLTTPVAIESEMPRSYLHPALLDCAFQLIIHAVRGRMELQSGTAYVPVKIGRLIFQPGKGRPVLARADLSRFSPHSLSAHFSLFDEHGQVVAWLRDVRFRSIRLQADGGDRLRLLKYEGVPRPNPLETPAPLPDFAAHLREALGASSRQLAKSGMMQPYALEVEPLLDVLCGAFAREAIKRVADDASQLTDARVTQLSRESPQTEALLRRLTGMMEEDETLVRQESGWLFRHAEEAPTPHDIWNALLADHPGHFAIFHAVGRVGMSLPDLLCGRTTAEKLLPQECTVGHMYAQALGMASRAATVALQSCISRALTRLPEGQRMRILEVGRGAPVFAGALSAIVDSDNCDYLIATTSRKTRQDWEIRSEQFPGTHICLFGSESDAQDEAMSGQAAGSFQFAILTNDFERDEDAQLALEYASRMLAPGGTLMMLTVPSSRWLDLVFGTTPGWWSGSAVANTAPFERTTQHWSRRIGELGFANESVISLVPEIASGSHVILAISPMRDVLLSSAPARSPVWLVLSEDGTGADEIHKLTRAIEATGGRAITTPSVSQGTDVSSIAAALEVVRLEHGQLEGIVYLPGSAHSEGGIVQQQVARCMFAASLLKACEKTHMETTCWLVTRGAATSLLPARKMTLADTEEAALLGFARTMMNEPSPVIIRAVDLERSGTGSASDAQIAALATELKAADDEQEVVLTQSGGRFVPRLRSQPRNLSRSKSAPLSTTLRLGFQFPGQLRNLRWEAYPREFPRADEIEIEVAATGLNFRDVMYALGLLSDEAVENGFAGPTLGLECSGVVIAVGAEVEGFGLGDRVVAFGPSSFSNHVLTKAIAVSRIPPGISFEAAATIPGTFFTAYYAINHLARLREGERILIHGAAGGVGVAAIQLAKFFGAEIFATAGSEDKRDFLRLLGVDHIFDSRSLAFADEILAVTNGEGVDVVLNSLAGEAINRNLRILKPFGRFLELGKRDFYENTKIGLRPFRNNISYFGIDADQLMQDQPALTQALFGEVMALFESGILHPLPYQLFEADDVVEAFRYMQQARQIGKIVVTYQNGINSVHAPKVAPSQLQLKPDGTYLVTGGLAGFGLRTAQWLVEKGAKNLVLISRRGAVEPEAQAAIIEFKARGVKVMASAVDVTDAGAMKSLFAKMAASMPPLRGLVHAAVVIEDALVRNTDAAQMQRVFAPKILGAQHLDELTRAMQLDFFVLYSSATTLFGNPGQGNYVAANTYLEALAEARRSAGLPALCVRWGAIEDAGFLARNVEIRDALQGRMGGNAILARDALAVLEELMTSNRSDMGVLDLDWKALARFLPTARTPKFSEMEAQGAESESASDHAEDIRRLLEELSPEELVATVKDLLKAEIGEILRLPIEKIDDTRSVYDMGLDSLMGVELALAIESRFGIRLPVMALSESPTIAKLADSIIARLKSADTAEESSPAAERTAQVQQVVGQHAAGVDSKAIEQFAKDMESGQVLKSGRIIH
ncbi:MAG: type I polyketide synthase [Betaproteobacteria bacterium]